MTRNIAAYVRVSTTDQDADRQRSAILNNYNTEDITWYVDIDSGSNNKREQYQDLRDDIDDYNAVVTTEIDRLGRSFSELVSFVEELRDKNIDLDCVQQPLSTIDNDDWMGDLMLNLMIVFADAERKMIIDRVQAGIDDAIANGKHVGRPPLGYGVSEGMLYQKPIEHARVVNFIKEVRKGREKTATAEFFEVPQSSIQSILERSEANYDVKFDNDDWRIERAKVEAGEKHLDSLGN